MRYYMEPGFISHQINLSLGLRAGRRSGGARATRVLGHVPCIICVSLPRVFCRNAQFFDIANSPVRETKKNYLFPYNIVRVCRCVRACVCARASRTYVIYI